MVAAQVFWRSFRFVFRLPWNLLKNSLSLVVGNPIISREIKVRMRFARAFWLQGAYLLFLIAIVLLAYQGIIAQSPLQHPAQLQMRLQEFYYVLLYSLVAIIVLIAPALTASAISFERERRTLDLLLTAPLRPMQILFGKLVASFAFLMLLLVESMPIVAVCIVMGGATVGDLLATYALIAFSTLHLCAFAIYCSACNRSSGVATFWAYLGTVAILGSTFWMALAEAVISVGRTFSGPIPPMGMPAQVIFPLASLHPFAAPVIKALPTKIFGVEIPCWLLGIIFSLLLTRFWLTAAAAKLPAVYRVNFVGSLRMQGLLLSAFAVLTLETALSASPIPTRPPSPAEDTVFMLFVSGVICAFVAFFIPWLATFGEHEGKPPANDGWFRPLRMFKPVASGALPFTLTWFLLVTGLLWALVFTRHPKGQPVWDLTAWGFGYLVLCLTFVWAIARFWSLVVRQLSLARWLSFGTLLLIVLLPGFSKWSLAYPFVRMAEELHSFQIQKSIMAFISQVQVHGLAFLVLTILLSIVCLILERRKKMKLEST
ncbi:MAG: ABC transporter permease [Armatimonadetes bacterium]|nr:ABC transporter permease [Armatimonadota bacterium]MDW8028334.1 ABC transporter permease [Armatimonadota bacterium]